MNDLEKKFQNLIKGMELPTFRKQDYVWLHKNMPTRNHEHPNFNEAKQILIEIMLQKSLIKRSEAKQE